MSAEWITPNCGDIVLLNKGFEHVGQDTGPHYGLVVGIFKLEYDHTKYLLVSSGTSYKSKYPLKPNIELLLPKPSHNIGNDTKFYFCDTHIELYDFPSESFGKNHTSKKPPFTTIVGTIDNPGVRLASIRSHYQGMKKLYSKVLKKYEIDIKDLRDINLKKPCGFLE